MIAPKRRIAMFDSGLGGLTVLAQLRRQIPDAEIIYAADSARVPYGDRPLEQVGGFARGIIAHLLTYEPSLIVIACGTSCSAFDALGYPPCAVTLLPIVDCGVVAAVQTTRNGRVGVVATAATARSGIFERKIREMLSQARVTSVGAPKLVPLIEAGSWLQADADTIVAAYCKAFGEAGCDTVVLGCTHFPLLRPAFENALAAGVSIVDPAFTCAERAAALVADNALGDGSLTFLVSGEVEPFVRHAVELTGTVAAPTRVRAVDFSDQVKQAEHR